MTCPILHCWLNLCFIFLLPFKLEYWITEDEGQGFKNGNFPSFPALPWRIALGFLFVCLFFLFKTVCRPLDIQNETAFCWANFAGLTASFSGIKLLLLVRLWGTLWKPTECDQKKINVCSFSSCSFTHLSFPRYFRFFVEDYFNWEHLSLWRHQTLNKKIICFQKIGNPQDPTSKNPKWLKILCGQRELPME